jgi:DNA-binding transcriptional LysR family regulator
VPLEIVQDRYGPETLVTIPLDEPWAQRDLVMAVRHYNSLPQATRLLVDHLRAVSTHIAAQ